METLGNQEQIVGEISLKNNSKDGLTIKADGITVNLGSRPRWENSYLLATAILPNPEEIGDKIGERAKQVADFLKREGEGEEGTELLFRTISKHLSESAGRNKRKSEGKISHFKKAIEVMSLVNREIIGPEKIKPSKKSLYPQGSPKQGRFSPPRTWQENRFKDKG